MVSQRNYAIKHLGRICQMRKQSVVSRELNINIKHKIDCLVQKFFDNTMSHQDCRLSERQFVLPI